MGLLLDTSTTSQVPKEIVKGYIINDKGDELKAYLNSLDKTEKDKMLSNSITRFGENVPLRQAIHHRSLTCIRALILCGADVGLPDGAKIILARNILLYNKEDDAQLAVIILRSYHGPLEDLPFAKAPPPGTCFATLARSHSAAWQLLPILALKGLKPVTTPDHDDMAILAQAAENIHDLVQTPSRDDIVLNDNIDGATDGSHVDSSSSSSSRPNVSLRKCIYEWMDAYYSSNHHHSLKNQCRICIRKALRVPDEQSVDELELPPTLKDYLLLRFVN